MHPEVMIPLVSHVGELEAMVSGSDPTLPRDTALYKLGELLMAESQPDRARPYFERLVEEFLG